MKDLDITHSNDAGMKRKSNEIAEKPAKRRKIMSPVERKQSFLAFEFSEFETFVFFQIICV